MKLSPRLRRILVTILAILTLGAPVATAPQASALDTCHSTDYSCLARWGYGPYVGGYPDTYYFAGHHNCTRYVAHRLNRAGVGDPGNWGDGGQWGASARARGYQVDNTPRPGSIGYASFGEHGHVAVVEQVSGDRVLVSEDNASGYNHDPSGYTRIAWYSKSWFSGYIHVPQLEAQYGSGGGGSPGKDPVGSFDTAQGGVGTVHVRGWSYDPDVLSHDVRIHIYIGGQAGTAGAQSTEIIANKARGDLRGTPAFDNVITTTKTGNQQVCAYAINVGGGNNKLLGCKNVTITARATTTNTPPPTTTTPPPPGDEPAPQPGRQAGSSLSS